MPFYIILLTILFIFIPSDAFAWGPATHLELGTRILDNLFLISPGISEILRLHPYDYLYGCMNADIVIGKGLMDRQRHCHNWNIGFDILKKAEEGHQKAFAYGYLSHLAADTIAHNYFVPIKIVTTFSTMTLRHVYWELRFDSAVEESVWSLMRRFANTSNNEHDMMLECTLGDTPLSFKTNKTIFTSILFVHRMEQWRKMINALSIRSKWVLSKDEREAFFLLSLGAAIDFLNEPDTAPCLQEDPTGRAKLLRARTLRRELNSLKRVNGPWRRVLDRALNEIRGPLFIP